MLTNDNRTNYGAVIVLIITLVGLTIIMFATITFALYGFFVFIGPSKSALQTYPPSISIYRNVLDEKFGPEILLLHERISLAWKQFEGDAEVRTFNFYIPATVPRWLLEYYIAINMRGFLPTILEKKDEMGAASFFVEIVPDVEYFFVE